MYKLDFKTKSGTLVATGYQRLVVGGRGSYIEFSESDLDLTKFKIPEDQAYRFKNYSGRGGTDWTKVVFYFEYRSIDGSYVKLYLQNRLVNYADYRIGYYYISINDLDFNGVLNEQ